MKVTRSGPDAASRPRRRTGRVREVAIASADAPEELLQDQMRPSIAERSCADLLALILSSDIPAAESGHYAARLLHDHGGLAGLARALSTGHDGDTELD